MIVKRSLSIRGHRTSISLEEPFWLWLRTLAGERGVSLPGLVASIDRDRAADHNLSSAIRVFVLHELSLRIEPQEPEMPEAQKFPLPA